MPYVNAHNGSRNLGRVLLHASPQPPVPASREGTRKWRATGQYRAACGRLVRNVTSQPWNPQGVGNHCPACIRKVPR